MLLYKGKQQYAVKIISLCKSILIEREGEYPTPVYHSVVSLDRGHDLYNIIHTYHSRPRGGGF